MESDAPTLKDRLIEGSLLACALLLLGLLGAMLGKLLLHIVCGLVFMGTCMYAVFRGQEARSVRARLAWFVGAGAVFFLFGYWALQVVFREPRPKTSLGCGGVKFIGPDGKVTYDGSAFGSQRPHDEL